MTVPGELLFLYMWNVFCKFSVLFPNFFPTISGWLPKKIFNIESKINPKNYLWVPIFPKITWLGRKASNQHTVYKESLFSMDLVGFGLLSMLYIFFGHRQRQSWFLNYFSLEGRQAHFDCYSLPPSHTLPEMVMKNKLLFHNEKQIVVP